MKINDDPWAHIEDAEEEDFSDFLCVDCGFNTIHCEYYMVHDEIWSGAGMPDEGMLCIGCLEERLGRELTAKDFTHAPVNQCEGGQKSERLQSRLSNHN